MYRRLKSRAARSTTSASPSSQPLPPSPVPPPLSPSAGDQGRQDDSGLLPPPFLRDRSSSEGGRDAERAEGEVVQRERRRSEELERQNSRGREAGVWSGWDRNSTTSFHSRTGSLDEHTIRGPSSLSSAHGAAIPPRSKSQARPQLARNASVPSSPSSSRFTAKTPSPKDEFHGFDLSPSSSRQHSPFADANGVQAYAFPPQESPALSSSALSSPGMEDQPARPSLLPRQTSSYLSPSSSLRRRHGRFPDDVEVEAGDAEMNSRSSRDEDENEDEDFTPVVLPSLLQHSASQTRDFDQRSSDLTTISEERSSRMSSARSNSLAGSSIAHTHNSSEGGRSSTFSGAGWEASGGGRHTIVSSFFGGMTGVSEEPDPETEAGERREGGEQWRVREGTSERDGSKRKTILYSSKSKLDPSPGSPTKLQPPEPSPLPSSSSGVMPGLEVPEFPLPPIRTSLEHPSSSSNSPEKKKMLSPAEAIAAQVRAEDDALRASSPMSALPSATSTASTGDGDGLEFRILDSHIGALVKSPVLETCPPPPFLPLANNIDASPPSERALTPTRPALMVSPPSADLLTPKFHLRQTSIDRALPALPPDASAPHSGSASTIVPTRSSFNLTPSPLTTPTRTPASVLFASALLTNHASNLHTTASSLNQKADDLAYASAEMLKHGKRLAGKSKEAKAEEEDPLKLFESSVILQRDGRELMEEAIRISGRALELAMKQAGEVRSELERRQEGFRKDKEDWEAERKAWEEERKKRVLEEEEETARVEQQARASGVRRYAVGGLDVPEDVISLTPSLTPSRPHTKYLSEATATTRTSGGATTPPLTPSNRLDFFPSPIRIQPPPSPSDRTHSLSPTSLNGLSETWKRSLSLASKKIRRRLSSESSDTGGNSTTMDDGGSGGKRLGLGGGGVRVKGGWGGSGKRKRSQGGGEV